MSTAARAVHDPLYYRPSTIAEAAGLLAEHQPGARLLAGGQTLIPEIDQPASGLTAIIDLGGVADLRAITWSDQHVEIGAMVTISQAREELADSFPIIAPCFGKIGNSAVRNRATLGGSVALADPASEIIAFLLAHDAELLMADPDAVLPVSRMLDARRPTVPFIRAVRIPFPRSDERTGFAEILRRRSGGRSLAMALIRLTADRAILIFSGGDRRPVRIEASDIADLSMWIDGITADIALPTRAWIIAAIARAIADAEQRPC